MNNVKSKEIKYFEAASENKDPQAISKENKDEVSFKLFERFSNNLIDAENLVIIAGSGTSLTFNTDGKKIAPSMGDLWDACKDGYYLGSFDDVLKKVNYHTCKQSGNDKDIELLLSLCVNHLHSGRDEKKEIEDFLNNSIAMISGETHFTENVEINEESWASHEMLFRKLARRGPKQQRMKLFTTNYDLAFETAASRTGFITIDGFEFSNPARFNPMWFHYDIVHRQIGKDAGVSYLPSIYHLYKVHGSVDWRNIDGKILKVSPDSRKGEPVFIYPSSTKYKSSYDTPYLEMISAFISALQKPRTAVLCLGFGFNDMHINNAISMALRTNPELTLMVATKSLFDEESSFNGEVRKLLRSAIQNGDGRIALLDATFADFMDILPDRRMQSPEENLLKMFESIFAKLNKKEDEEPF